MRYDAIVVGLGAMGAATLAALAARGRRVLGLERFPLPHAFGSSQGGTRIIREAYFEDPRYVPLVQRAYTLWEALEAATGTRLVVPTGGLTIGSPEGRLVAGALASARTHGLAHDVIDAADLVRRHPGVRVPAGAVAVFEPRAGVVLAARAIAAFLAVARRAGAEVRAGAAVEAWEATAAGIEIRVAGETIRCARLVLAAGSWMPGLAPILAPLLTVERNAVHWFRPRAGAADPGDGLPVLVIEDTPSHLLYAVPSMRAHGADLEDGIKFACHHSGVFTTPETVDRTPSAADVEAIQTDVARYLPDVDPVPVQSAVCCYTNAPDGHFIVDRHPDDDRVVLVSPCSGHGFKFSPVLGELVADVLADVNVPETLAPFALGRYSRLEPRR